MYQLSNRLLYFLSDFYIYVIILLVTVIIGILFVWKLHKNPQKHTNMLLTLIAGIIASITVFVIAEAYFRYIYEASDGIGFLKIAQKWHNRHVIFSSNFRRDNREFTLAKTPNEVRIGVMGDSITFGIGIENPEDRFSDILERKLRKDGINAVVYNLGMSGIDTDDEIEDFHRLEPKNLQFDLMVWQYFLNDNNTATTSANAQITKRGAQRLRKNLLLKFIVDHSFFADFLYWRLSTKHDQIFKELVAEDLRLYHEPSIIRGHQAQIHEFISELKSKNLPVIVIMFPLIHSEEIRQQSRNEYKDMLKVFQLASPSAIIDLEKAFAPYSIKKLRASRFDQHPNEFAHQIAAELLYENIKVLAR